MDGNPLPEGLRLHWLVDKEGDEFPERDHMLSILYPDAPLLSGIEAEEWLATRRKHGWVAAWAYDGGQPDSYRAYYYRERRRPNAFLTRRSDLSNEDVAEREKLVRAEPYLRLLLERPKGLEVARIMRITGRCPAKYGYGTDAFRIDQDQHPIVMHAARGSPALELLTKWTRIKSRVPVAHASPGEMKKAYVAWAQKHRPAPPPDMAQAA